MRSITAQQKRKTATTHLIKTGAASGQANERRGGSLTWPQLADPLARSQWPLDHLTWARLHYLNRQMWQLVHCTPLHLTALTALTRGSFFLLSFFSSSHLSHRRLPPLRLRRRLPHSDSR